VHMFLYAQLLQQRQPQKCFCTETEMFLYSCCSKDNRNVSVQKQMFLYSCAYRKCFCTVVAAKTATEMFLYRNILYTLCGLCCNKHIQSVQTETVSFRQKLCCNNCTVVAAKTAKSVQTAHRRCVYNVARWMCIRIRMFPTYIGFLHI